MHLFLLILMVVCLVVLIGLLGYAWWRLRRHLDNGNQRRRE